MDTDGAPRCLAEMQPSDNEELGWTIRALHN